MAACCRGLMGASPGPSSCLSAIGLELEQRALLEARKSDEHSGSNLTMGLRAMPDRCLEMGIAWEAICGIPSGGRDSTSSDSGGCMHVSFV